MEYCTVPFGVCKTYCEIIKLVVCINGLSNTMTSVLRIQRYAGAAVNKLSLFGKGARCFASAIGQEIISPTIGLSDDQLEFYKSARSFADKELRPYSSKWDEDSIFPVETFKKSAELGFAGVLVREDVGGSALSRLDNVVVVEALATGCVGTVSMLCVHNMCAGMIDRFGNDEQRQRWLPSLCQVDLMASYCITEPGSGSDASSLVTKARFDASTNEYVLNGAKVFISGAGISDLYLVMCRTGESSSASAISCIVVPKDTPGLTFGANEKKMGLRCTPTRQVSFEEVRVPAANR